VCVCVRVRARLFVCVRAHANAYSSMHVEKSTQGNGESVLKEEGRLKEY